MQDRTPRTAGTDQHDRMILGRILQLMSLGQQYKTIGKTCSQHHQELDHDTDRIVRPGHTPVFRRIQKHGNTGPDRMDHKCDARGQHDPLQLHKAGISPHRLIQAALPEDQKCQDHIDGCKMHIRIDIILLDHTDTAVKTQPERKKIRQIQHDGIINHQCNCHKLPMLNFSFLRCH